MSFFSVVRGEEKHPNVTVAEVDLIQLGEQSVAEAQSCGPQV